MLRRWLAPLVPLVFVAASATSAPADETHAALADFGDPTVPCTYAIE
jgi:hypothetical protein